jgi:hypothetical protein
MQSGGRLTMVNVARDSGDDSEGQTFDKFQD